MTFGRRVSREPLHRVIEQATGRNIVAGLHRHQRSVAFAGREQEAVGESAGRLDYAIEARRGDIQTPQPKGNAASPQARDGDLRLRVDVAESVIGNDVAKMAESTDQIGRPPYAPYIAAISAASSRRPASTNQRRAWVQFSTSASSGVSPGQSARLVGSVTTPVRRRRKYPRAPERVRPHHRVPQASRRHRRGSCRTCSVADCYA